jgi:hypothetical protein
MTRLLAPALSYPSCASVQVKNEFVDNFENVPPVLITALITKSKIYPF